MKIIAIIPAYNSEKTVGRAIESVLRQTRPADEIIIIDDGSTDHTAEVVGAYGDKVKLIRQENAGVSVARNRGIEAAAGDWIAFLDADDEWLPDKLKLQVDHLTRHPALKWTFTNMSWDKEQTGVVKPIHPVSILNTICQGKEYFDDYLHAYAIGFFASTITLMIHRDVFKHVGVFVPGMKRAQDNDLWYRIAYQYPKIGYLPESLSVYHLDTPSSSTKINDNVDFMRTLITRHEKLSKEHGRYEAFSPCISRILQNWIRDLVGQRRRNEARFLLEEFADYLSFRFRREMQFRLVVPMGSAIAEGVLRLKKTFKPR